MLATEDSYEELDYDLNVDAPVQQTRRERLASGTIASIVEEHIGSVEELATEATELEVFTKIFNLVQPWGLK